MISNKINKSSVRQRQKKKHEQLATTSCSNKNVKLFFFSIEDAYDRSVKEIVRWSTERKNKLTKAENIA